LDFQGKKVVVTGGGMGIGEGIALKFADHGADLILLDIDLKAAQNVEKRITSQGRSCLTIKVDVSDRIAVDKAFDQILKNLGWVDVLINNAGITQPALDVTELDPDTWNRVVDVDFKGVYNCTRAAGKIMVNQHSGAIVNIASGAGIISVPLVAYAPAKAAVIHFTKIVARGWVAKGVRVNAIAPGVVLTPLVENAIKAGWRDRDTFLKAIPMHQFIMPEDIAEAALFLCSNKARFITGITLPVDAGVIAEGGWAGYGQ
jgi:NAD(P)-dependent dehydrogenase (short-subunit alcohol dehydrogenase family)